MEYTLSTTELEEAALTVFVARENQLRIDAGVAPYADHQAYVTATAARLVFDPVVSLFIEAYVVRLGAQAREATLAELLAADAALPG